jgi:hypothetical protein
MQPKLATLSPIRWLNCSSCERLFRTPKRQPAKKQVRMWDLVGGDPNFDIAPRFDPPRYAIDLLEMEFPTAGRRLRR